MKGFLKDGPAAVQVVDVGDPPMRRGVIVLGDFGEGAHRYYLCSVDARGALYTHVGKVTWPPEVRAPGHPSASSGSRGDLRAGAALAVAYGS
jgi:hypothetical protein